MGVDLVGPQQADYRRRDDLPRPFFLTADRQHHRKIGCDELGVKPGGLVLFIDQRDGRTTRAALSQLQILLIYLAIFAPVAMSALAGVKSAQQVRIRAAQSLGASRAQVLWFVILPGALPEILTGLRIGLGVGWSTLVAAELIAATRGLGFMVQSAGEFLATDVVLAGIAVIAIIAFLLELGLRALQRRLTPWHGEVQ